MIAGCGALAIPRSWRRRARSRSPTTPHRRARRLTPDAMTTQAPPRLMSALTIDIERDDWDTTTGLTLESVPAPVLDPDDPADAENVLLRVHYAGFCGSDRGIWWRKSFKDMIHNSVRAEIDAGYAPGGGPEKPLTTRVIGHEVYGEIVGLGPLAAERWGLAVGQFCASESHIVCGRCYQCRNGEMHVCARDIIIGISRDGCFAEYIKLPARVLWPNDPERIRHEVAAIMEPFGNAVHCCEKVDLRGKTVGIFGTGTIGQMTTLAALELGASRILGVDISEHNAAIAKRLGCETVVLAGSPRRSAGGSPASHALAPSASTGSRAGEPPALQPDRPKHAHDPAIVEALRDLTDGIGIDLAIEMTGNNASLNSAIKSVRRGGDVILFGLQNADFQIEDYHRVIMNGINLHSVVGRRLYETWNRVQRMLEAKQNGVQDKIWNVLLNQGQGTIHPLSTFDATAFEKAFQTNPKVLINPRA